MRSVELQTQKIIVRGYKKNNEQHAGMPNTSLQRAMCHINIKQFRIVLRCEKDATNIIDYNMCDTRRERHRHS